MCVRVFVCDVSLSVNEKPIRQEVWSECSSLRWGGWSIFRGCASVSVSGGFYQRKIKGRAQGRQSSQLTHCQSVRASPQRHKSSLGYNTWDREASCKMLWTFIGTLKRSYFLYMQADYFEAQCNHGEASESSTKERCRERVWIILICPDWNWCFCNTIIHEVMLHFNICLCVSWKLWFGYWKFSCFHCRMAL